MFHKNPKQVYLPCFIFKKLILSAQMIINIHESIWENIRHTRLIIGSFQLKYTDTTTKNIINEPQRSQGIVYPTYKQLTVCHNDHNSYHTTVLGSCYILISSWWHSLSVSIKLSRDLLVLWLKMPVLWRVPYSLENRHFRP